MTAKCTDLIARLEKATGPDRDLDTLIALTINPGWEYDSPGYIYQAGCGSADSQRIRVRYYTASIDAALTLVPDGWAWNIWNDTKYARACGALLSLWGKTNVDVRGAATLAIALCIAALKAREYQP